MLDCEHPIIGSGGEQVIDERKLKSKMVLAGITQQDLAKLMNKSANTISAKIKGVSRLYLDEIDEMCNVLGIYSVEEKADIFLSNATHFRDAQDDRR